MRFKIPEGSLLSHTLASEGNSVTSLLHWSHHEIGSPQPRTGGQDSFLWRSGEDGQGGGRGQAQVGQQSPVHPHLCGLLHRHRKRVAVPILVPKSRRRWVQMNSEDDFLIVSWFYFFKPNFSSFFFQNQKYKIIVPCALILKLPLRWHNWWTASESVSHPMEFSTGFFLLSLKTIVK